MSDSVYKYEIVTRHNGTFDFRIWHQNGNLICNSNQGYENRSDCEVAMSNMFAGIQAGRISEK